MSHFLHSPVTVGICLVLLVTWVTMLCAIFWPRKNDEDDGDGPRILF